MCKSDAVLLCNCLASNRYPSHSVKFHLLPSVSLVLVLLFLSQVWLPAPAFAVADWYVRLIVTASDGRVDKGNVLGRDPESVDGRDIHDLVENPPPGSCGATYLSIILASCRNPRYGYCLRCRCCC